MVFQNKKFWLLMSFCWLLVGGLNARGFLFNKLMGYRYGMLTLWWYIQKSLVP